MNERGFTIIEVIVAVVIFGVTMLCGLSFYTHGYTTFRRAQEQFYALQIVHNELAQARIQCPVSCPPFNNDEESGMKKVQYIPALDQYYETYLSWNKVEYPFGVSAKEEHKCVYDWYKIITATVTWKSNSDKSEHTISLCTLGVKAPTHTAKKEEKKPKKEKDIDNDDSDDSDYTDNDNDGDDGDYDDDDDDDDDGDDGDDEDDGDDGDDSGQDDKEANTCW